MCVFKTAFVCLFVYLCARACLCAPRNFSLCGFEVIFLFTNAHNQRSNRFALKPPSGSWMGGWMDGWMDGWIDGWMGGWMDG